MPSTRTLKSGKKPKVTILQQAVNTLMTVPAESPRTCDEIVKQAQRTAKDLGISMGPRYTMWFENHLAACDANGLIKVDFQSKTFVVTARGQSKFDSIRAAMESDHGDDPARIMFALFAAIKSHIGPLRGQTKPQLLLINQQMRGEIEKANATIRGHERLAAAQSDRPAAPTTPLRQTMSFSYPTPVSRPCVPRGQLNLIGITIPGTPPSPSPLRSHTVDIDEGLEPLPESLASSLGVATTASTIEPSSAQEEALQQRISQLERELQKCSVETEVDRLQIVELKKEISVLKASKVKDDVEIAKLMKRVVELSGIVEKAKRHVWSLAQDLGGFEVRVASDA